MKSLRTRKSTITYTRALQILFCFCVLLTGTMLILQPARDHITLWLCYRTYFIMPLMNLLPLLFASILLFTITESLSLSMGAVFYIGLLMALTNRIKLLTRGDPLLHWDLGMVSEAFGIANGINRWLLPLFCAFTVGTVILFAILNKHIAVIHNPLRDRIIRFAAVLATAMLANATLFSSAALNTWLPVYGSFYNMADVHNSRGNLYSFIYNANRHKAKKPSGYDPLRIAQATADASKDPAQIVQQADRPHIIMVMGEAFSDLSESPAFDFTAHRDPLESFKALGDSFLSGHIVVPSRGGGTADTEFDVLTGRVSRYFRSAPYSYRLVTHKTEALPSVLSLAGYKSLALHPGYRWFYNRQNVYPNLGFEEIVFEDAFPSEAYMDEYISEAATFDKLLSLLDAHLAEQPDSPLFAFCVTIQNHAAYKDRYLAPGTLLFDSDVHFSDEYANILSNYFAGTIDADVQLARLATYLNALAEPAIVVYFGDHLPSLDMPLYDMMIDGEDAEDGSLLKETRLYKTPFIVWMNDAAREQTDIEARALQFPLPENATMSSNYLGAYVLELLGLSELSPYFDYENDLRDVFPILMESQNFKADGTEAADASQDEQEMLSLFQDWVYYRMTNE